MDEVEERWDEGEWLYRSCWWCLIFRRTRDELRVIGQVFKDKIRGLPSGEW